MAFPYFNPDANQAVQNGQGFFRIKQTLTSAGDIFEVPQGGHAFVLGPDSDISQATVGYVDQLSRPWYSSQASPTQTNLATMSITPQRAFGGLVSAVNADTQYVPAGVPGRILIWPTELYDPTFLPPSYDSPEQGLVLEPPIIDIIQYFSPPPALFPPRADKTYYYDTLPFGTDEEVCWVMIPYYGRRYASIQILNTGSLGSAVSVGIYGITFRQADGITSDYPIYTLLGLGAPFLNPQGDAVTGPRSIVLGSGFNQISYPTFNANDAQPSSGDLSLYQGGLFDYLAIQLINEFAVATKDAVLRVTVSDIVGRTGV